MAPIKEIECNHNQMCFIRCEDFDVKAEVENTGPFSFNLADDVYVLPPIPNQLVDFDRLKVHIGRQTYLKPLLVPKYEIVNMYEDVAKSSSSSSHPTYSSLLFKTFPNVAEEVVNLLACGLGFVPSGYVVSKSSHGAAWYKGSENSAVREVCDENRQAYDRCHARHDEIL